VLVSLEDVKSVQSRIKSIFNDPLTEIMLNNSHLTKIQAETLLIENISENLLNQKIGYDTKAKMRHTIEKVSRGAFNRTLHQANKNIIASIYTIFFLGYIGILETPSLEGFIETSNKLATYIKEHRELLKGGKNTLKNVNKAKSLLLLKNELKTSLNTIIASKSRPTDVV
jgi:hypothetical protein